MKTMSNHLNIYLCPHLNLTFLSERLNPMFLLEHSTDNTECHWVKPSFTKLVC